MYLDSFEGTEGRCEPGACPSLELFQSSLQGEKCSPRNMDQLYDIKVYLVVKRALGECDLN